MIYTVHHSVHREGVVQQSQAGWCGLWWPWCLQLYSLDRYLRRRWSPPGSQHPRAWRSALGRSPGAWDQIHNTVMPPGAWDQIQITVISPGAWDQIHNAVMSHGARDQVHNTVMSPGAWDQIRHCVMSLETHCDVREVWAIRWAIEWRWEIERWVLERRWEIEKKTLPYTESSLHRDEPGPAWTHSTGPLWFQTPGSPHGPVLQHRRNPLINMHILDLQYSYYHCVKC